MRSLGCGDPDALDDLARAVGGTWHTAVPDPDGRGGAGAMSSVPSWWPAAPNLRMLTARRSTTAGRLGAYQRGA
jgi:hypothetical protein